MKTENIDAKVHQCFLALTQEKIIHLIAQADAYRLVFNAIEDIIENGSYPQDKYCLSRLNSLRHIQEWLDWVLDGFQNEINELQEEMHL